MRRTTPTDRKTTLTVTIPAEPCCPVCGYHLLPTHAWFGTPIVCCGRAECQSGAHADRLWAKLNNIDFGPVVMTAAGALFYVPIPGTIDPIHTLAEQIRWELINASYEPTDHAPIDRYESQERTASAIAEQRHHGPSVA